MSESIYTHYTYLLVDENHKKYGGVRSCKNTPEKDPYMGTSNPVDNAIDNGLIFTKHIIKTFDTREEANEYESDWLVRVGAAQSDDWYNQYNTFPKFDFSGKTHTEGTRRKISKGLMGRKPSEKQHKVMLGNQFAKGHKHTEEHNKKLGIRSLGNQFAKGHKHTEEHNKKLGIRSLGNQYGKGNKGKKQSEEHIRKRVEAGLRTKAKKKGTVV